MHRAGLVSRFSSVTELFDRQVERCPDTVALTYHGEEITYRGLAARVSQAERFFRSYGLGAERIVAVCARRTPETVAAILGILRSGAAYLPIDPESPGPRIDFYLGDSGADLLVTDLPSSARSGVAVVRLRDIFQQPGTDPPTAVAVDPSQAAYAIYTSGSTGTPKAVVVEHRSLSSFLASWDEHLEDSFSSRTWVWSSSIAFDVSILELLWPLTRGYRIVLHRDEVGLESLPAEILSNEVSHFQCTPSVARLLLKLPDGPRAVAQLSKMLVGGEAMSPQLASVLTSVTASDILNVYGPTETTVWASVDAVRTPGDKVVIGNALPNASIYVLDSDMVPAAPGQIGEIYIGGAGVARGYLNRPGLTGERFIADPFSSPNGRMYRTGDLARVLGGGQLEFIGRTDFQIKLRGHRIEIGEIESVLLQHPNVDRAVVTFHENGYESYLVAHVVKRDSEKQ